jgi:hypothetical protein
MATSTESPSIKPDEPSTRFVPEGGSQTNVRAYEKYVKLDHQASNKLFNDPLRPNALQVNPDELAHWYIQSVEGGDAAEMAEILQRAKRPRTHTTFVHQLFAQVEQGPADLRERVLSSTLELSPEVGSTLVKSMITGEQELTRREWELLNENWRALQLDSTSEARLLVRAVQEDVRDIVVRFASTSFGSQKIDDPKFINTLQDLVNQFEDPATQAELLLQLSSIVPILSLQLGQVYHDSPHPEIRRAAALILALSGQTEAVELVEQLLDDPDEAVRSTAVEALRILGDSGARPAAILALGRSAERTGDLRTWAMRAIAQLPYPETHVVLNRFLLSVDTELREFTNMTRGEWAKL